MFKVILHDFSTECVLVANFEGDLAAKDARQFANSLRVFFDHDNYVIMSTANGFSVRGKTSFFERAEVSVREAS